MNFKTLLTTCLFLSACFSLRAQDDHEADSLRHQFGRMSVSSARSTATPYADTLDTDNPAVKVVLYNNGTFRYVKDPKALRDDKVFTEHWDTRSVNPYHDEKPLPDRFSLWIVDTLDSYCCPNKTTPSSKFGYRHGRRHQGIDLPYPTGTPVYAAFDGKVRVSDYVGGYGNLIIIGLGGSTGRSSGPHLHFETRYQGYAFDPTWLIDFETGTLRHRLLRFRSWYFNPNSRYVQSFDDEDEIYRTDEEERLLAEEKAKKEAEARAAAERAAVKYYRVQSGDTLGKIAKKNHTTVKALCRLNGIKETTTLQIGRRLRVK